MMKKILVPILILIMLANARELNFEFQFGQPEFVQRDGHMLIDMENCMPQGVQGEPLLPYRAFSILLPPGETLKSADLNILASETYPLMLPLLPKQLDRPLSLGKSGKFLKDEAVYSKNAYSAGKLRARVHYFGGAAVLVGAMIPADYFPAQGRIDLNNLVELQVETMPVDKDITLSYHDMDQLRALVDNPDMLNAYTPAKTNGPEKMLIISSPVYESAFDTLIKHYAKYGIEAEFMSTNDINTYAGQDLQEKIRKVISAYYVANGLNYVLLGGNTMIVPARGLSCNVWSDGWVSSNNIPSDLYYAALDDNWDTNRNGIYGEYNDTTGFDEADLIPELAIGRFPAENLEQMENMIAKSIRYQTSPIVDEMDKHVFFGEFLWADPESWGADYMELLIGTRNDNGYTTVGLPSNLTIKKWYDQDSLDYWDKTTVKEELADGYSFLHHDGHANTSYMMKFSYNELNDSDFVTVNGIDHTTPVFYSHGCNCGGFDNYNCIASKIVTSPYISVGGLFNSRYGWFNEGQTEGPSIHLHREFENAIYGEHETQMGRALSISRGATAPWVTAMGQHEQNALRWNFYTINVLGDPAMRIYSQKPLAPDVDYNLSNLHVGIISATIQSDSNPIENATLTVLDSSGMIIGVSRSDEQGKASLVLPGAPAVGTFLKCFVSGENLLLSDTTIVSSQSSIEPADDYVLLKSYPNPFNPQATIWYSIPEASDVSIAIYDVNGRFVEQVVDDYRMAGAYSVEFYAQDLSSGIYLCRMDLGYNVFTTKLILLK